MSVRFYVDSWDPSYGSALDTAEPGPDEPSSAALDLEVERPAQAWEPLSAPAQLRPPAVLRLVDGVRRIDARVWVEEADGTLLPTLAASYAAGVVRCDLARGVAELTHAVVRRGLFTPSTQASTLGSGLTGYPPHRVDVTDPGRLGATVQQPLLALEAELSTVDRTDDDLLIVDGPLRGRDELPRTLGYVKTHDKQYLPPEQAAIVGRLRPGQRTPVFQLGTTWHRFSWYLKLPGGGASPWAAVVRVEASATLARGAVTGLADRSAVTLPLLASSPYKDPRAPQNLVPIAGLESRLRRMLGDPRLLVRALTVAAATGDLVSAGRG
jgi:hypothetical protein